MSWNYRIVDYGDHVSLHEVYYDDDGNISGYVDDVCVTGEDYEGINEMLEMMLHDCKYRPVLKAEELP